MKKTLVPDGKISRAVREGLELREKMLADGMDELEVDRIVGKGLQAAWGDSIGQSGRFWGYYCNECKDTGWIETAPDVERIRRLYGEDGACHPFYLKCDPCRWQNSEREVRAKQKADAQ